MSRRVWALNSVHEWPHLADGTSPVVRLQWRNSAVRPHREQNVNHLTYHLPHLRLLKSYTQVSLNIFPAWIPPLTTTYLLATTLRLCPHRPSGADPSSDSSVLQEKGVDLTAMAAEASGAAPQGATLTV